MKVEVEAAQAAARKVLEDGANQHQYPYLLAEKEAQAIADPASYEVAGDGRKAEGLGGAAVVDAEPKAEKKPKLSKEERVQKMRDGKAAKKAAKQAKEPAAPAAEPSA